MSDDAPPYTDAEVAALAAAFEACTLPHSAWTHRAHLIVALHYLFDSEETEGTSRLSGDIRRYNESRGIVTTETSGYHETLTRFWAKLVRHFLDEHREKAFSLGMLAIALTDTYSDKDLPFTYYSRERLLSPEARRAWSEPDLKPLPAPSARSTLFSPGVPPGPGDQHCLKR